ncbi:interleukin-12 subunit alpha [Xiphophorus hellerii]|uniref:interleukin-12 subunit alpha n=1 Tax=Xiphophorus hellerii TaxID=8084 RepID=UPI0013B40BFD|nr:interleukin-12 subunit alpha-like [Xiphophorus hellerii]
MRFLNLFIYFLFTVPFWLCGCPKLDAIAGVDVSPAGFSSCAALPLMLMLLNWRTSTGLPLPPSANNSAQCASLFRNLLLSVTEVLKSEDLCSNLIKSNEMPIRSSETVRACSPASTQNSGCGMLSNSSFNSSFSENECVMNIMRDLAFYHTAIETYLKSPLHRPETEIPLLSPTLGILRDLRKNCSSMETGERNPSEDAPGRWGNASYVNRQKMCKMMRGFHVRAVTINRAVGYISSGDHRK